MIETPLEMCPRLYGDTDDIGKEIRCLLRNAFEILDTIDKGQDYSACRNSDTLPLRMAMAILLRYPIQNLTALRAIKCSITFAASM